MKLLQQIKMLHDETIIKQISTTEQFPTTQILSIKISNGKWTS